MWLMCKHSGQRLPFVRFFKYFALVVFSVAFFANAELSYPAGTRILVVGGGPSGLSAAHFLRKAGYANVVVAEKNSEVGGKTLTVKHDGKNWEMGAIMSGPSYKEVIALAKEFNQKIVKFSPGSTDMVQYSAENASISPMTLEQMLGYAKAAFEYEVIYLKYRDFLDAPGLQRAPDDLNQPFSQWAEKHVKHSTELQELLAHSFVSFGYGYLSEVPAAYVLKYFSPALLNSFITGQINMLENGYQELWKSVAKSLKVENDFEVSSAEKENGEWKVKSKTGKEIICDIIIYTGPLDVAAQTVGMLPQLKNIFSKIKYQHYYSTLVEIDGLPRGSGVVPENYRASNQGSIVSWLHRWPKDSNVANFYTLSDSEISPETVETQIRDFADQNGFKVRAVVKNVGWRYFPHFDGETLASKPYLAIEGAQGKGGLYFAGELMNFSTVEHSVEYAKGLIGNYFNSPETLAFELPKNYRAMAADEKTKFLWDQILRTEYNVMPDYKDLAGSMWKDFLGFFPAALGKAFSNNNDVLAKGRQKIIHKLGSVATFRFDPADAGYNSFNGLIRLSTAVDPKSSPLFPSFSIKIPRDTGEASINFNVGKSFDGQKIGNDPKGKTDFNFFRDDSRYPFSNELPLEPNSIAGKAFKWVFDRAHFFPNYIPVTEMTKVMNRAAPRRFVFRATEELQAMMDSKTYQNEREVFAAIPAGKILFHVYESTGLNDAGTFVGNMTSTSRFVASQFGDENLYFRHEKQGVKNQKTGFLSRFWKSKDDSQITSQNRCLNFY